MLLTDIIHSESKGVQDEITLLLVYMTKLLNNHCLCSHGDYLDSSQELQSFLSLSSQNFSDMCNFCC